MIMKIRFFPYIALSGLFFMRTGLTGLQAQEPLTLPTLENAVHLLQTIENRFTDLQTLRYQVSRTSQKGRQSQTERWMFSYRAPDCIRIDYLYPQERLIVINTDEIWEYIPRMQKAMRTDLKTMSTEEKQKRIASTMSRISVDGLHPGSLETVKKAIHRVIPSPHDDRVWILEGRQPRILFEIDSEHSTMIKSEIYDTANELVLKTDAADFREIADGFWFPHSIKAVYRDGREFITASIFLEQAELNTELSDSLFQFHPPARVEIITTAEK